jgi:hypothetical protein
MSELGILEVASRAVHVSSPSLHLRSDFLSARVRCLFVHSLAEIGDGSWAGYECNCSAQVEQTWRQGVRGDLWKPAGLSS